MVSAKNGGITRELHAKIGQLSMENDFAIRSLVVLQDHFILIFSESYRNYDWSSHHHIENVKANMAHDIVARVLLA